jgi:predicted small secreted protein
MKKYYLRIFAILMTSTFGLAVSGCNTVDGVGKDLNKAGHEISEEANEHDHN